MERRKAQRPAERGSGALPLFFLFLLCKQCCKPMLIITLVILHPLFIRLSFSLLSLLSSRSRSCSRSLSFTDPTSSRCRPSGCLGPPSAYERGSWPISHTLSFFKSLSLAFFLIFSLFVCIIILSFSFFFSVFPLIFPFTSLGRPAEKHC